VARFRRSCQRQCHWQRCGLVVVGILFLLFLVLVVVDIFVDIFIRLLLVVLFFVLFFVLLVLVAVLFTVEQQRSQCARCAGACVWQLD